MLCPANDLGAARPTISRGGQRANVLITQKPTCSMLWRQKRNIQPSRTSSETLQ
jgi:hypothetical protein